MGKLALIVAVLVAVAGAAYLLWPKPPFDFLAQAEHLPSAVYLAGDVWIPEKNAPDIYVLQGDWESTIAKATKELKERGYGFIQGAGSNAVNFINQARKQVSIMNDVRILHKDGKNVNSREKGWITVQIHEKPWP